MGAGCVAHGLRRAEAAEKKSGAPDPGFRLASLWDRQDAHFQFSRTQTTGCAAAALPKSWAARKAVLRACIRVGAALGKYGSRQGVKCSRNWLFRRVTSFGWPFQWASPQTGKNIA